MLVNFQLDKIEQLASISREHDIVALQQYGGKGIHGDDADLLKQRNAFGSNNYPRKKGRSLLVLWDYESSKIVGLDRVRDVHGKIRGMSHRLLPKVNLLVRVQGSIEISHLPGTPAFAV
ncbi:hypothetical protein JHK82_055846 [Glycine max]|nr:hypothetical protein JHK86_055668 [Glycine max]KAG4918392.1 hypothetical protein JHK85_056673 [Glycine max]KAG5074481.1 hypothetical protein JHK84_055712 [Glycine max]KAG5077151.1 hypothetical protein JHK82_055846 [Glycine max]